MADRYSTGIRSTVGCTPRDWYNRFVVSATFVPAGKSRQVSARTANGSVISVPIEKSAICFKNAKVIRDGSQGGSRCVEGEPQLDLVVLDEAIGFKLGSDGVNIFGVRGSHKIVAPGDGLFPLGVPTNEAARVVLNDLAAKWISQDGQAWEHHPDHINNMFMSCIKTLIFHLALQAESEPQRRMFQNAVDAVQTAQRVMWSAIPASYNLIPPLVQDQQSRDSMQRFIGFALAKPSDAFRDETDRQIRHYEVLELSLKRMVKYNATNWTTKPPFGIFACFLITPLVLRAIDEDLSAEDSLEKYNRQLTETFDAIGHLKKNGRLSPEEVNVEILRAIIQHDNLTPTVPKPQSAAVPFSTNADEEIAWTTVASRKTVKAQKVAQRPQVDCLTQFYRFCMTASNYNQRVPYVEWGLINIPKPSHSGLKLMDVIHVDGLKVKRDVPIQLPLKRVYGDGENVSFQHSCPTQWGALSLHKDGVYTFTAMVIGAPQIAAGDSRNIEQVANMRFTTNGDGVIFHNTRESYSTAGSRFRQFGSKWDYEHTAPLDVTTDIVVKVQPKEVIISQGHSNIRLPRQNSEAVVVGVKYMNLNVKFASNGADSVEKCGLASAIASLQV